MADIPDEELTIGGKRIETLRVVDLKAELKKRGLSNSGTKNQLIKRLKTQVTLEKLQEASQSDVLPSQKIAADETVGANEFIQQYLKQQQELLAQRESLQAAAAAHQADVEQARERKESGSGGGDGSSGTGFGIPAALADQVEELNESLSKQKSVEELSFEDQEKEDSSHGDEEKEKEEEEEKPGDKTDKDAKDIHEEQDNEGKCERSEPEVKVAKEEEPKEPKEEVARQQKHEESVADVKKKDETEAVDDQRKQESNLTETDRAGQEKPRQGDRDATSDKQGKGGEKEGQEEPVDDAESDEEMPEAEKETKGEDTSQRQVKVQQEMVIEADKTSHFEEREVEKGKPRPEDEKMGVDDKNDEDRRREEQDERTEEETMQKADKEKENENDSERRERKEKYKEESGSSSSSSSRSNSSSSSSSSSSSESEDEERNTKKANKDNENDVRGSGSEGTRESRSRSQSRSRSRSNSPERQPHEESYHTAPEHEMSMEENKDGNVRQQDDPKPKQATEEEVKEDETKKIQDNEEDKEDKEDVKVQEKETKAADPWRSVSPSKLTKHRKMISITSRREESKKEESGEGSEVKTEPGARKRRWGSKTGKNSTSNKKPALSISTESLKAIIPDIKTSQMDPVTVDLATEDTHMSDLEENPPHSPAAEEIKIRRTVTQVVPSVPTEDDNDDSQSSQQHKSPSHEKSTTQQDDDVEPMDVGATEQKKVTTPKVIRRPSSNLPVDEPVTMGDKPSPARMPISKIVHVMNLVRPFTILQLKELLGRTGTMVEDGFWIDKIKSHCFVTYEAEEDAITTREALHGTKWPSSNPKNLIVEYAQQSEIDRQKGITDRTEVKVEEKPGMVSRERRDSQRDRDRERRERERERERGRDRDRDQDRMKRRERSTSRENKRRERERGDKQQREVKKEAEPEEPPAKLLDDLFRKTKATPCIYWLPLTQQEIAVKEKERLERNKQREERRKKIEQERQEEEERREKERQKRRQEQRRSRSRSRDRRRR